MSWIELLSLFGIAYSAAWTPGPNNTLAANFGARFGFRATIPHICGIFIGFPFMIFCIGIGLGALFQQSPVLREILRWIGIAVLVWMAWRIANSGKPKDDTSAKPFTFWQSFGFQWINPKGWVMAISAISQFARGDTVILSSAIVASVFITAGITSASGWAYFGASLQKLLKTESHWRIFNIVMALGLLFSVFLIAFADFA